MMARTESRVTIHMAASRPHLSSQTGETKAKENAMSTSDDGTPLMDTEAWIEKDGENWTLLVVRFLRHSMR